MRKELGKFPAVFPMPVLMVAAYDKNGVINVMNAAWGMVASSDKIVLFLDEDHKTTQNIFKTKAFTVALADKAHMKEADYFGLVTGNKVPDKFAKSGLHAVKSEKVNAPVIEEFPVCMECELAEVFHTETIEGIVGKIVSLSADEKVLGENGKVDPLKLDAILFDQFQAGYYTIGEKVGRAWNAGAELVK